jgi:hypothetical protein
MTPSSFLRAYVAHDLGGDLHRLAQRAAVVAAAVYVAGMAAGVVIHWANDWLSGDRRPWPVTWGAVAKPRPRLCDRYSKLIIKTETTVGTPGTPSSVRVLDMSATSTVTSAPNPSAMVSPGWAVFVDLDTWSVTELRAMAKAKGRMHVYRASARGFIPISQASKSELIAELET